MRVCVCALDVSMIWMGNYKGIRKLLLDCLCVFECECGGRVCACLIGKCASSTPFPFSSVKINFQQKPQFRTKTKINQYANSVCVCVCVCGIEWAHILIDMRRIATNFPFWKQICIYSFRCIDGVEIIKCSFSKWIKSNTVALLFKSGLLKCYPLPVCIYINSIEIENL